MSEIASVNLLKTNDLHFSKKSVCGTDVAQNKLVKNMSMFNGSPISCTKNVLDYLSVRQKVIASNVANVNTPGYKTRDVSFSSILEAKDGELKLKLARTHEKHFPKGAEGGLSEVDTYLAYSPVNKNDGVNDVDLDKEMVKEGEVQVNFNLFSDILSRKYRSISNTIKGTI
jgi:flagellar basal-body rod protein FlgB